MPHWCLTCPAVGAVQEDWRTHLISTLRKQTVLNHNPEPTQTTATLLYSSFFEGTHRTSLPQTWQGGAVLWWSTTRGRQTPQLTHIQHFFSLTFNKDWGKTEMRMWSRNKRCGSLLSLHWLYLLCELHLPRATSCLWCSGHMTSCFGWRFQQTAK